MTIIRPNIQKGFARFFILVFGMGIIGGVLCIKEYTAFANARHEVKLLKASIAEAKSKNIDLKNQLYTITDLENLKSLEETRVLVLESHPKYLLESNKWVSVLPL